VSRRSVLIVGSGAREHALAWKLRQSSDISRLYVAPGNAGTAELAENAPLAATDVEGIVRLVEERDVALTIVGPEAPLALGLADRLHSKGRRVVGPNASAARIESSKAFAKDLMAQAGVPTARYAVFDRPDDALRYLAGETYPVVIKADGLAAGKGVSVCTGPDEARSVIQAMMVDRLHGEAGGRVVIEEALRGPEVSLIALVDGSRVVPLPPAQDHKRLGEGDTGPNTGGMGAYAPVPFLDAAQWRALAAMVLEPVVAALAEMGSPYQGFLFAGLMLTEAGPRVLEFNCRLGDPEAQVILPLLDGDLLPWLEATAAGSKSGSGLPLQGEVSVTSQSAVGVVLAAPGYPQKLEVGTWIEGLDSLPTGVLAFHAGTALGEAGHVVTAGGRVMTVVATGATIEEAAERAYAAPIHFDGMQRRRDIAWQVRPLTPLTPLPPSPSRGVGGGGGGGGRIPLLAPGGTGAGAPDRAAGGQGGEGGSHRRPRLR
jgi:phosphoribosylamine--glycine ligase